MSRELLHISTMKSNTTLIPRREGGALGFSVFRFWCLLRFAVFPFLSIWFSVSSQTASGFWIWHPLWFSVFLFGFREFSDSLQTQTLVCVQDFLFPISYFLFPVSYFLFPVSCFLFPVSCFLFPVSYFLFP